MDPAGRVTGFAGGWGVSVRNVETEDSCGTLGHPVW